GVEYLPWSAAIAALAFEGPARSQGRDALEAAQDHGPRQLDQQGTQPATKLAQVLETGGWRVRPARRERVRILELLLADGNLLERGAAGATPDEHGGRRRTEGVCELTR